MSEKIIYCDECKKEFLLRSNYIDKVKIVIESKELLLEYFFCPYCNAIYKILIVDEEKYNNLLNDIKSTEKRIVKVYGKKDPENLEKVYRLESLLRKKRERIKLYVSKMDKKYSGTFYLSVKDGERKIEYLP